MRIIEARDGFVKLETEKSVKISSFIEIKGLEKRYIAQIVRIKNNGAGKTVYAKLLFVYDGSLIKYDRTLPDITAEVNPLSFEIINNAFSLMNPIVAGKFIEDGSDIFLDKNCFNNSTLISVDSVEMNNIIVSNLAKQFKQNGKVIIIDMTGVLNGEKFVAGRDFKLPLNKASLEFLYEDCLKEATSDSKSMIRDIFRDLAEYSDEVNFVPFITLKTIVDDMVEKSHIFKLLVLKNKLAKFDSFGYFASSKADADNLLNIINSEYVVLDLSHIDPLFQNRFLSVIYSEIGKLSDNVQIFLEASNAITKKNLKQIIYPENGAKTVFITHSKFKYLNELKNLYKNFFVESTYTNKEIFKTYAFFLEGTASKNYMIVGEGSNYIPLLSKVEKYDVPVKPTVPDITASEIISSEYDSDITDGVVSETEYTNELIESQENVKTVEEETAEDYDLTESVENKPEELMYQVQEDAKIEPESEEILPENTDKEVVEDSEELNETEEITELDEKNEPEKSEKEEFHTNVDTTTSQETEIIEEISSHEENFEEEAEDISIPQGLEDDYEEVKDWDNEPEFVEQGNELDEKEQQFVEPEVLPLDNQEPDFDEIVELDESEISDDDILVDLTDNESDFSADELSELSPEELDRKITEDVDKVFTTIKEDTISDSDLDFIDELNDYDEAGLTDNNDDSAIFNSGDVETLEELSSDEDEEGFLEPLEEVSDTNDFTEDKEVLEKRDTSTPIVPVYDAEIPDEDKIMSDHVEQGDNVIHAKYGNGVVEKVIKYGNKTLHSINFDNVGRRLLDLEITEVKKA